MGKVGRNDGQSKKAAGGNGSLLIIELSWLELFSVLVTQCCLHGHFMWAEQAQPWGQFLLIKVPVEQFAWTRKDAQTPTMTKTRA